MCPIDFIPDRMFSSHRKSCWIEYGNSIWHWWMSEIFYFLDLLFDPAIELIFPSWWVTWFSVVMFLPLSVKCLLPKAINPRYSLFLPLRSPYLVYLRYSWRISEPCSYVCYKFLFEKKEQLGPNKKIFGHLKSLTIPKQKIKKFTCCWHLLSLVLEET